VNTLELAITERLVRLSSPNPNEASRIELRDFLLAYAKANALSVGLIVNWQDQPEPKPVHFEVMPLTLRMIHAFNFTNSSMTTDERELVGEWLHKIVKLVLSGSWGDRQDNKVYYRSQIAFAWGTLVGDSDLVANALDNFRHAIREMRPDGSFISESSRAGSANLYQSQATDSLISLALAIYENLGINSFAFDYDGKSVFTAANRTLDAFQDQVKIASQYGKSCDGGAFGSTSSPDSRWGDLRDISFLRILPHISGTHPVQERIALMGWEASYWPQREGIDLMSVLSLSSSN
jgi:hypothetical protein